MRCMHFKVFTKEYSFQGLIKVTGYVYPTYVGKSIGLNRFSAPILTIVLLKKGSCHLIEVTFYEPLSSMANNKVSMNGHDGN